MEPTSPRVSLDGLPHGFSDKCARRLRLQLLEEALHQSLLDMYLAFQPRNCFQGLPPIRDEVCTQWVRDMVRNATNLVACGAGDLHAAAGSRDECTTSRAILGHAALFPIDGSRCEMLVVVSSSFQNLGLGTELVKGSIRAARESGFQQIWIPVAATNVRARHVYEKCGFQYLSRGLSRELEMTCELKPAPENRGRTAISGPGFAPVSAPVAAEGLVSVW